MSVKKSIAVCKLNGAHAAIEDNTKHVESRLQENKKLLVHLSLHCLFCLLLGVHNTSKFKEESCSDSKLLYIHAVEIQCYRETRILFSLRAEHLSAWLCAIRAQHLCVPSARQSDFQNYGAQTCSKAVSAISRTTGWFSLQLPRRDSNWKRVSIMAAMGHCRQLT